MKNKIPFNSFFLIGYLIIFLISCILALCFGRLLYFLTAITLILFIFYFIRISKKDRISLKKKIICSVAVLMLYPIFLFVSGLVSYRPNYSYHFYKMTSLKNSPIFNDNIPSDAKVIDFRISMEKQRGQKICVTYSTENITEVIDYYNKSSIAKGDSNHSIQYNNQTYYFIFNSFLKGNSDDYVIYYIDLSDEHQSGAAINSKEKIVMLFET
ncbi:MAG: hypothetical protein IJK31_06845 [Ruminococcus sp.]|nr:hypothetical protein [Ruminococcus sp.]